MQKSKDSLQDIIINLESQKEYVQHMINDIDMRIRKNKEAGNIPTVENLSSIQKEEIQNLVKEQLGINSEETSSQHSPTTAKKLMPKMKDKV